MARNHAKVLVQVWRDKDWTGHTIEAQWIYWLLLSQPKLTLVGSLEVTEGRWAQFGANATRGMIEAALAELEAADKIVHDRSTDELLIRTFTSHDLDANRINVNLAKGLWGQWATIASDLIRWLAIEFMPDEIWDKLEPHAPSDAAHIRRSSRLEPRWESRSQPGASPRLEPPPSSLLSPDTSHRPAEPAAPVDPVDKPVVASLLDKLDQVKATNERSRLHAVPDEGEGQGAAETPADPVVSAALTSGAHS